MRKRPWLGLILCVGSAALISIAVHAECTRQWWLRWRHPFPVAEFPHALRMGEHELNDLAKIDFFITNSGGRELVIDEIHTNCACSGLIANVEGRPQIAESLRIGPGESVPVELQVKVHGRPGDAMLNAVTFRTNDPNLPRGLIEATVSKLRGGLIASPPAVNFGTVLVGQPARVLFDIYDGGVKGRRVGTIGSTCTARFTARLLPAADAAASLRDHSTPTPATLVGRCEVVANTDQPGPLEGEVHVWINGDNRPPTIVQVLGRVAGAVDVFPSALVLPRRTMGKEVYFADCVCRSNQTGPWSLDPSAPQPGWTVKIRKVAGNPTLRRVHIEWIESAAKRAHFDGRETISLVARFGKIEKVVQIPVLCHARGGQS